MKLTTHHPIVDACSLFPRGKAVPQAIWGWLLVLGGGANLVLFTSLLVRGNREGIGPGILMALMLLGGVAELSGVFSRRRWRRARAQLAARSTDLAVRWRYEWPQVIVALGGLLMFGLLSAVLVSGSQTPWQYLDAMLMLLVVVLFAYATLFLLVNVRSIAWQPDGLVYSSGPFPFRRAKRFSATRVIVTRLPNSEPTLTAESPAGFEAITSVYSLELAICIADELNARQQRDLEKTDSKSAAARAFWV